MACKNNFYIVRFFNLFWVFLSVSCQQQVITNKPIATFHEPTLLPTTENTPNGLIAFVSDRRQQNNLDIWLMDVKTNQLKMLSYDNSQDWGPIWSPNGQKIAYLSAKNQTDVYITIIDLETEIKKEQLVPDIRSFSWSRDGETLWLDRGSGLWLYNIGTSSLISFLENGKTMVESSNDLFGAFITQDATMGTSFVIKNQKDDSVPVTFTYQILDNAVIDDLAWANNTFKIIVTLLPMKRQYGGKLLVFPLDDGVFESNIILEADPGMMYCFPAWSLNSDRFFSYTISWLYAETPCLGDVYVTEHQLGQTFHIATNATVTKQPWSSDGHYLVYAENAKSPWWAPSRSFGFIGEGKIWITSYDGGEKILLTDGDWYDGEAVWQPSVP